jgi:hypothetical protein
LSLGTATIGSVILALELEEINQSLQSPHHNVVGITGIAGQAATVSENSALVAVQQTAGGANVTLSVNSIVTGGAGLGASTAPAVTTGGVDPTMLLSLVGNPAFAILNSFPVASALLLREAFVHGSSIVSAGSTTAVAIDAINVGVSEFSPHHNTGMSGTITQTGLSVTSNQNLVTVQQAAGLANVQASINQIVVGTGAIIAGTSLTF